MKQKDIFLAGEADQWFYRNHTALNSKIFDLSDLVVAAISNIVSSSSDKNRLKILEIGCGEASRLAWLADNFGVEVCGLEPSAKAVEFAISKGVNAQQGTADWLPYEDQTFDVVIFGFCLYLCDRDDLFKIAQEADRVLKKESWLIINDFFSPTPISRDYHHKQGRLLIQNGL